MFGTFCGDWVWSSQPSLTHIHLKHISVYSATQTQMLVSGGREVTEQQQGGVSVVGGGGVKTG